MEGITQFQFIEIKMALQWLSELWSSSSNSIDWRDFVCCGGSVDPSLLDNTDIPLVIVIPRFDDNEVHSKSSTTENSSSEGALHIQVDKNIPFDESPSGDKASGWPTVPTGASSSNGGDAQHQKSKCWSPNEEHNKSAFRFEI